MIYIFSRPFFRGEKGGTLTIPAPPIYESRQGASHRICGSLCIASLGGRRLAVRTAMEHPIGALPRTPFPASRDFPSRGNEKIGGTGYCVTYDTDSQSRNAPCVPFRGRGPRSGEGVDGGKNDYEIFLFYVLSPPKGEMTHYILRVASAPSPTAVTDSLDFQVA